MGKKNFSELLEGVKKGDARALSRLITRVENRDAGWRQAMKELFPICGKARIIGITGSPGAGKSTLTNALCEKLANQGLGVGVIAVDPSSPFSGGALLGDRLRMVEAATHPNVFIRSMATRGALGGLCQGARDVARILDAFGKDVVLIETVGVGQDEIEVVKTADCVMVVLTPGQGDGIQALKAGIMEIADVYVVNKADRPGADEVVADVAAMLSLCERDSHDPPPVLKVSALNKAGMDELARELFARLEKSKNRDSWLLDRMREEVLQLASAQVLEKLVGQLGGDKALDEYAGEIMAHKTDPYSVAEILAAQYMKEACDENKG